MFYFIFFKSLNYLVLYLFPLIVFLIITKNKYEEVLYLGAFYEEVSSCYKFDIKIWHKIVWLDGWVDNSDLTQKVILNEGNDILIQVNNINNYNRRDLYKVIDIYNEFRINMSYLYKSNNKDGDVYLAKEIVDRCKTEYINTALHLVYIGVITVSICTIPFLVS